MITSKIKYYIFFTLLLTIYMNGINSVFALSSYNANEDKERNADTLSREVIELRDQADILRNNAINNTSTTSQTIIVNERTQTEIDAEAIIKLNLESSVDKFRDAKESLKADPTSIDKQKKLILFIAESLVNHDNVLRSRVEKLPAVSQDLKRAIEAEIYADVAKINEIISRVDSANTYAELKDLASELASYRKNANQKRLRKLMILAYVESYEHGIIASVEARSLLILDQINILNSNNVETADLSILLERIVYSIEEVRNSISSLKEQILINDIDLDRLEQIEQIMSRIKNSFRSIYIIFLEMSSIATEMNIN